MTLLSPSRSSRFSVGSLVEVVVVVVEVRVFSMVDWAAAVSEVVDGVGEEVGVEVFGDGVDDWFSCWRSCVVSGCVWSTCAVWEEEEDSEVCSGDCC